MHRCLLSKCYSAGASILFTDASEVDPDRTSLSATDFLLYCYYGAMIHIGTSYTLDSFFLLQCSELHELQMFSSWKCGTEYDMRSSGDLLPLCRKEEIQRSCTTTPASLDSTNNGCQCYHNGCLQEICLGLSYTQRWIFCWAAWDPQKEFRFQLHICAVEEEKTFTFCSSAWTQKGKQRKSSSH